MSDAPSPIGALGPQVQTAFMAANGLVLDEVSGQRVVGHIDLGPEHHQPYGIVHGGVYATAIETMGSIGGAMAAQDRGFRWGVNNNTHFLAAVSEGRVDRGRAERPGPHPAAVDHRRDPGADGRLVATGQLRLQNIEPRHGRFPAGPPPVDAAPPTRRDVPRDVQALSDSCPGRQMLCRISVSVV